MNVDIDNKNDITIKLGNTNPIKVKINDYKYFDFSENNIKKIENSNNNNNVKKFIESQKKLRALDMMKDGSASTPTISVQSVLNIAYQDITNLPFSKLKDIEDIFFESVNTQIEKLPWTKIYNSNDKKIYIDVAFQESGLDSSYFISNPNLKFCTNFANEVLDPASRKSNNNSFDFPEMEKQIKLTEKFLNLFGFINCSVEATKKNENKDYEFKIKIGSLEIKKQTQNGVDFFMGNVKKNNYINNTSGNQVNKNALLVCKEMGDVLQVLFMLIWKNKNPDKTYCISTCDYVVALLCIMLNLSYTLAVKKKATENEPKVKYMEYYNSGGTSRTSTQGSRRNTQQSIQQEKKLKFEKEKENIINENQKYIQVITELKNKSEQIRLTISGYSETYIFSNDFYKNIIDDYNEIQKKLISFKYSNSLDITNFKQNFTLIRLIVKSGASYKLCSNNKYTFKKNLYNFTSKFGNLYNGINSFISIGKNNFLLPVSRMIRGGISNELMDVVENIDIADEKILEFCDEKAWFYNKDGEDESNENNEYDLYDILKRNIEEKLEDISLNDYFEDFYNILLYYFYFYDEVYYDEELEKIIEEIKNDFINIEEVTDKISLEQNKMSLEQGKMFLEEGKMSEKTDFPKSQVFNQFEQTTPEKSKNPYQSIITTTKKKYRMPKNYSTLFGNIKADSLNKTKKRRISSSKENKEPLNLETTKKIRISSSKEALTPEPTRRYLVSGGLKKNKTKKIKKTKKTKKTKKIKKTKKTKKINKTN